MGPLAGSPSFTPAISGISLSEPNCLLVTLILPLATDMAWVSAKRTLSTRSAVLHADIALGADVEPRLKPILKGHRGHVEVISQALQAEVPSLFHAATIAGHEMSF